MEDVPERHDFPGAEEAVLASWQANKTFERSLERRAGSPEYTFYDGPPFATGLPHYGHILAGTIKDTVTRYAAQSGHYVARRFGWDCHGLPIEFEIDKEHGIRTKDDVLAWGIGNYNEACRAIVQRYAGEWERIVQRLGRWIDFKHDYKTMDASFMESVWWVFSELHRKGLVYRGVKVMPYSTACTTPLSNFEANLNYKDVQDPAIVVAFPLADEPDTALLAWTTTPWTLPSNLALCVNASFEYVLVEVLATHAKYVLLEGRLASVWKKPDTELRVLARLRGSELTGRAYVPLFDFYAEYAVTGAFRVVCDDYVSAESGTGIVHQAPGFGEDDLRVCLREGIVQRDQYVPCPVDDSGRLTVGPWAGTHVKEADKAITRDLKAAGRLVLQSTVTHSYPFCWRSDTPLIYRTVPSWFVRVEQLRDRLVAHNATTHWVPAQVQEKRFRNWLEDARDWAVSRNRYWGTPLPIWANADFSEIVVVGSIAELEQRAGLAPGSVTDLHRHHVDAITLPSASGGPPLQRVPEVFDCWFESGSMPYAQAHYPFENKERFEATFPADFIAEGIDQTRGWFYTLLVLSTALFDTAPFKHLIVNGLVLAADGKKMSKRLKNYPDPVLVVDRYGADALRLYLINSPVVRADNLKFVESGVGDVIRDVFLRWYHAYRLLVLQARRIADDGRLAALQAAIAAPQSAGGSVLDRWIEAALHSLIAFVRAEMAAYRLYTVVPRLVKFISDLANWYVRLNRVRFKGAEGSDAEVASVAVLHRVLLRLTVAMAPFTPFFTEHLYLNLRRLLSTDQQLDSVHFADYPAVDEAAADPVLERRIARMQTVVELARVCRERRRRPMKQPLAELVVYQADAEYLADLKALEPFLLDELNVRTLTLRAQTGGAAISLKALPDNKRLGQRLRGDRRKVFDALAKLTSTELEEFEKAGSMTLEGHVLTLEDVTLVREFVGDKEQHEAAWNSEVLVVLNVGLTDELELEGLMRELINRVQRARKAAGLLAGDNGVSAHWAASGVAAEKLTTAIATHGAAIEKKTQCVLMAETVTGTALHQSETAVGDATFTLTLVRR